MALNEKQLFQIKIFLYSSVISIDFREDSQKCQNIDYISICPLINYFI